MNLPLKVTLAIVAVMGTIFPTKDLFAQSSTPELQNSQPRSMIDAKYIPTDAILLISVWPHAVAELSGMELAPLELATAASIEHLGVDICKVERLDFIMGMPGIGGPVYGAMVTMTETIDVASMQIPYFTSDEMIDNKGFKYRPLQGPFNNIVHQLNANTAVVGTLPYVSIISKGKNKGGEIAPLLSKIDSQFHYFSIVGLKQLRPVIEGFVEGQLQANSLRLPQERLTEIAQLVQDVDYLMLQGDYHSNSQIRITIGSPDDGASLRVNKTISNFIVLGKEGFENAILSLAADQSPKIQAATQKWLVRFGNEANLLFNPQHLDSTTVIELRDESLVLVNLAFQALSIAGNISNPRAGQAGMEPVNPF